MKNVATRMGVYIYIYIYIAKLLKEYLSNICTRKICTLFSV